MFAAFMILLVLAVLVSWLLVGGLRWRRTAGESAIASGLFALILVSLALWSAFLWIPPTGPAFLGVTWVPLLVVGVLVIMLLAAAAPPPTTRADGPPTPAGEGAWGMFFWIAVIVFGMLIVAALAAAP